MSPAKSAPGVEDSLAWERAQDCFRVVSASGLDASLECVHTEGGQNGDTNTAELTIVIARNLRYPTGLLHEDIAFAEKTAREFGGRLWLGQPDNRLSILWPTHDPPAPAGQEGSAQETKRAARGQAKRKRS